MLTRADIDNCNDAQVTPFEVPEWGGSVGVRVLDGRARRRYERVCEQFAGDETDRESLPDIRTLLCAMCICDAAGVPLYTESEVAALDARSSTATHAIFRFASALNKLGPTAVEDEKKTLPPTP
jgi:hypothetical protein